MSTPLGNAPLPPLLERLHEVYDMLGMTKEEYMPRPEDTLGERLTRSLQNLEKCRALASERDRKEKRVIIPELAMVLDKDGRAHSLIPYPDLSQLRLS